MTREHLADAAYFDELIARIDEKIERARSIFVENKFEGGMRADSVGNAIVSNQLDNAKAAYSRGDPIAEVQARVWGVEPEP